MFHDFFQWIYDLPISQTIAGGTWQFPALEVTHIYSMVLMVTVIALFDLNFMGFPVGRETISQLARIALRWVWACLGVNAASGMLLFMSRATEYYGNPAFQAKLLLIAIGVSVHTVIFRRATKWDDVPSMARRTKLLLGCSSLLLWFGVMFASRWIAYAVPGYE